MSEESTTSASEAGTRPVFLTVLCILSFIAAGFAIIGYIGALALMGAAEAAVGAAADAVSAAGGDASAGPSTAIIWAYIIIGFATTIVALLGVIKMWKLNKQGFTLYAGATVVSVIMGIVYAGISASLVSIVISGAFIAMYYVNVKHMS